LQEAPVEALNQINHPVDLTLGQSQGNTRQYADADYVENTNDHDKSYADFHKTLLFIISGRLML
jgi:hypothetical protein